MHKSEFPVEIQCASSLDEEWCRRTEHPIGLDENMQKLPLELNPEPEEGTEMHISDLIHKLANDGNVEVDFWIDDRFPFTGLDRRICRDCIFNKSITWEACKCDRLDKEEFRRRYIRQRCEYHKTTGTALSEYERKEKEIRDQNTIGNFIILPMELAHCRETYKPI